MLDGFRFLFSLDLAGLVIVFWFFFIFELPRYTLSTLAVGWRAAFEERLPMPDPDIPVSVLLVGHNEGDKLERAVRGLKEQSHRNLQIVVVDDGSTDNMAAVGHRLHTAHMIDAFVPTGLRGGKAGGLNLGLQYCEHELVVVMDIDTSLDRDAIDRAIAPLLAWPYCGAVSGNLAVRNPYESVMTSFQALEYFSNISVGRQFTAMFNILTIVSGAFGAFRKSAILSVGGWDVGPGDDSNLTTKLRVAGWYIHFEPHAWALTDVPATHSALFRQRLRWNRSLIRNRFRKFRTVFNVFDANFSLREMIAALNLLWFHLVLTVAFAFYITFLFTQLTAIALPIIIAVHVLTVMSDALEFAVASLFTPRPGMIRLVPYLIGYTFYIAYYQRLNRAIAYLSELVFRHSYADPFYPTKVREAQDQF